MANITCPATDQLRQDLPTDINYVIRATTNASSDATAMTACCAPNPANFIENCYVWCEYPAKFSSESLAEFMACLQQNGADDQAVFGRLPGSEDGEEALGTARVPNLRALALMVFVLGAFAAV